MQIEEDQIPFLRPDQWEAGTTEKAVIVDEGMAVTKKGNTIPFLVVKLQCNQENKRLSLYCLKGECIKAWGKETTTWKNKIVLISREGDKGKVVPA